MFLQFPKGSIISYLLSATCVIGGLKARAEDSTALSLIVTENGKPEPLPCRVYLVNEQGEGIQPPGLPFWKDHFSCLGSVHVKLSPGKYRYEVAHGPEFTSEKGAVEIHVGASVELKVQLERIADLASEGWWSGETHIHRPMDEAELLMRSEDLHVGHIVTWWNQVNPWQAPSKSPKGAPIQFGANYFYDRICGEDERDGGALLFLNLNETVGVTRALKHYPSSSVYAHQARKMKSEVWIDAEKPFWWDLPLWIAEGLIDTVGIANNHMLQFGVIDNEAWGKPRDVQNFPAPTGNGLWAQEIYFHLLNCGIRVPPSAGSASEVLPNPVGYNRIYARVEGALTYEKWVAAVKAGRTFVTNGPLLRCTADGEDPSHVFAAKADGKISLKARLSSRDKVKAIELVQNGKVIRSTPHNGDKLDLGQISTEPGWFLIRCLAEVPETFRFACTAPFYVERTDGKPRISKSSAQFFVDWCRERVTNIGGNPAFSNEQRVETLAIWKDAEAFWMEKFRTANAD